ncbi:hypothetical protein RCT23_14080, partial [Escherichia marmotae]|nr:hypothetical protein [Escherichia marmotae]
RMRFAYPAYKISLRLVIAGLIRRASVASGAECRMRFAYPAYKISLRLAIAGLIRRASVASGVAYLMPLISDEIRNTLRSSAARL